MLKIEKYWKATTVEAQPITGVVSGHLYGGSLHAILPLVVARGLEARRIFFLVDSSSPHISVHSGSTLYVHRSLAFE